MRRCDESARAQGRRRGIIITQYGTSTEYYASKRDREREKNLTVGNGPEVVVVGENGCNLARVPASILADKPALSSASIVQSVSDICAISVSRTALFPGSGRKSQVTSPPKIKTTLDRCI